MPRLARIRVPFLADLVEQLRYAPPDTLRRQIEASYELAFDLVPDRTYPEDWIIVRITGFRPDLDDPALLVGEALLIDLSAFIEHLTEVARFAIDDVPSPHLGYDELIERWHVSRKTIDRMRRRGLVAYRARDEANATHLRFPLRMVQHIEAQHADRLGRARIFAHVSDDDEATIISRAREARLEGLSLTRTAASIAPDLGRAAETVRQIIVRHDRHAADPVFPPSSTLDGESRAAIARAFEEGESIDTICRTFHRSRGTVYRLVNERRAEVLRAIVDADAEPLAEREIERRLGRASVRTDLDATPCADLSALLEAAATDGPIDARRERERTDAIVALEVRAAQTTQELPRYDPPAAMLDRAETDLRWAMRLRLLLVQSQRALIVRSLQARLPMPVDRLPPETIRTLHDACFDVAMEAVRTFDPRRGGRVAAPVSLALNRHLAGVQVDELTMPGGARRAADADVRLNDWRPRLSPVHATLFPLDHLRRDPDAVDQSTRHVLSLRFGWSGGPPLTVEETATMLDISPIRVRRLQRMAGRLTPG